MPSLCPLSSGFAGERARVRGPPVEKTFYRKTVPEKLL
jgi:hypothetical protein